MVAENINVLRTRTFVRVPGRGLILDLRPRVLDLSKLSPLISAVAPLPRSIIQRLQYQQPPPQPQPPSKAADASNLKDNMTSINDRKRKRMDSEDDNNCNQNKKKNNKPQPPHLIPLSTTIRELLQERETLRNENQRLTRRLEQLLSFFRNKAYVQRLADVLATD